MDKRFVSFEIKRFFLWIVPDKSFLTFPDREPTLVFVNCKWKFSKRENLTCFVLFLNLLLCEVKWNLFYDAKTMFKSTLQPLLISTMLADGLIVDSTVNTDHSYDQLGKICASLTITKNSSAPCVIKQVWSVV